MSLLIVLVNYGTAPMTLEATAAAVQAARELDCPWSIGVVDNRSPDDSVAVLQRGIDAQRAAATPGWEQVSLLASAENGGFGAGNNLLIRPALAADPAPEYVYLLNTDAFPEAGSLLTLKRFMDAHPRAAAAGSYIHGVEGEPHTTAFRFPSVASEFEEGIRLGLVTRLLERRRVSLPIPAAETEVDWVAGASMLLRTAALRESGLFDERFFLYFEETELCLRLRRRGWQTWYVPQSAVAHIGGATTGLKELRRRRVPRYWLDSRYHYFTVSHGWFCMLLANLARTAGMWLWQIRRFVQRKEPAHPPHLLADIWTHFLARSVGREPAAK